MSATNMPTATPAIATDAALRAHVAARARELGGAPERTAIAIERVAVAGVPATAMFRAEWQDDEGERSVAGVIAGERIVSRALDAIALLFDAWRTHLGGPPDATTAARACAFLLDAERRHRVLATVDDDGTQVATDAGLAPAYDGPTGGPPLVFFWRDPQARLTRLEIDLGSDGRWRVDARRIATDPVNAEPGTQAGDET
ncbi:MAG: hypothetical protein KDG52_18210 [Rhodocyclaceae bacterium]|nr:hypothetical protein [Rhodocyclaceae bacterium]